MVELIIVGILVYFFIVKPFLKRREEKNWSSFLSIPENVKELIVNEDVFELAEFLVHLELKKEYAMMRMILEAIEHKGFSFAKRVDRIRNEMRIKAGLGSLKHF
ncbi:hypothetical protein [Flavobacterium solisilvae]|uniref:Uncharacterized protein n=1 Tax=Flavobacterium solisilvae TaxID=1852019 RepID=A0ABX1QVW2_9FLAO|nr:hypothetical protein [Flavobacterium solisilvae]NMH24969.1 hypothetical protein [Flavobacterium solisilvae]